MCVRSKGKVIILSVGRSVCLFVSLFVCTKSGVGAKQASVWALLATRESEIILVTTYLTNESVLQVAEKSRLFIFLLILATFT